MKKKNNKITISLQKYIVLYIQTGDSSFKMRQ